MENNITEWLILWSFCLHSNVTSVPEVNLNTVLHFILLTLPQIILIEFVLIT